MSGHRRDFAIYLAVGFSAMLALRCAGGSSLLAARQEQLTDWLVRMNAGTGSEAYAGPPFVWLDLDEESYRRWGEPYWAPRAALARLLDVATASGAALVLLDVDLSRRTDAGDEALLRSLAAREPGAAPVVLARAFREARPGSGELEPRPSFLDEALRAAAGVHWASTRFERDADYRVRRMSAYETWCVDQRAARLPSLPLLAAALVLAKDGAARTGEALATLGDACPEHGGRRAVLRVGERDLPLRGDRVSRRILYEFGAGGAGIPMVVFRGAKVPLLTRIPAHVVSAAEGPAASLLGGRIVMIGASYADSGDLRATPLGEMPGALVLLNATYTLLRHGALKRPPEWAIASAQILVLVVASALLARLSPLRAALVGIPLAALLFMPTALYLFRRGIWLDFAVPLLLVQLLAMANRQLERRALRAAGRPAA